MMSGVEIMSEKRVRGVVLKQAVDVINGERQDVYGNPEDTFDIIARFWTTYLQTRFKDVVIFPPDVAMMMVLLKIAREAGGRGKLDNIVDLAGYAGLYGDMEYPMP